ncbi:MAG: hypothetical protein IPJ84_20545 [Bdellovibrionales bacterium]|nr:hypothetical protein [Bdellovibrionales bacterium]
MPHSFEKFLTGRSGTLAAAWDHAAASAPWSTLMKEWIGLTVAIRNTLRNSPGSPSIDREALEKRLAFLGWDLEARVQPLSVDNHIRAFFTDLGFRPAPKGSGEPDGSLLDTVLSRHEGAGSALTILFAWATETVSKTSSESHTKLSVEFVKNAPAHIVRLRFSDTSNDAPDERAEYISAEKNGQKLESSDWIDWCHGKTALERLSVSDVWIRLMLELRAALEKPSTRWPESAGLRAQVLLLDQLIALRPSLIRLFADRAMLRHRLGDNAGALDDLKRFFAFQDRGSAAPALVSLYDLLRLTPRQPVP